MREIKFRAWNKLTKEMFKVGQLTVANGNWSFNPDDSDYKGVSLPYQPHIKVMQYTGLKDKNGVEIYEGDIVEFAPFNKRIRGEVKHGDYLHSKCDEYACVHYGFYIECEFGGYITDNTGHCLYEATGCDAEVIGNIYENSEWLEVEE